MLIVSGIASALIVAVVAMGVMGFIKFDGFAPTNQTNNQNTNQTINGTIPQPPTNQTTNGTVTPPPPPSIELTILGKSGYIDGHGIPTIVGYIKNTGNINLKNVLLNGSFLCSEGNLINGDTDHPATILGHSELNILAPGETAPFKLVLPPDFVNLTYVVDNVKKYQVTVVSYETTSDTPNRSFVFSQTNGVKNAAGFYELTGIVKNTGNVTADNVSVIGVFTKTGQLLTAAHAYVGTLLPGQETSFLITVADSLVSRSISNYRLQVEAQ